MDTNGTNGADKKSIDEYRKKIKNSGLRLTATRTIILDIFIENLRNLSAEELFLLSHKKYPKIGQATIYRNLKMLEEEGIIERAGYKDNKAEYRIKRYGDSGLKKSDLEIEKGNSGKNKGREDGEDANRQLDIEQKSIREKYEDMEKISAIQDQLTKWLSDLNKIKREKELELEDTIEDFIKVDKIIDYHNHQRNKLIQILLDVQNEFMWLPKHILLYISNKMDIPLTNIYDIATFYKYFSLEPKGKHSIVVCLGTACHIRGAASLLQRVENVLGIKPGDTTSDYNFSLSTVNCLGCCALGPVVMIENKYYSNPSTAHLEKILKKLD
jgi:NADH-quinone oxidoreductase subunit E